MYHARKDCNCQSLAVRAIRLSWSKAAADGCRSVTELPAVRQWQRLIRFGWLLLPRIIRTTVTKWSGGWGMTVRKHTHHQDLRKNPLPYTLHHFRTGPYHAARASVKWEYRFNNNTDIHCSKGQRAEPDNTTNMTLSELLWDMQNNVWIRDTTAEQLSTLTFSERVGLTRMRFCRVSLAWIYVGSCMPERGNNARSPSIPDSHPHRVTNTSVT